MATPAASRRPARRSHEERSAETRARILAAVVESVADVGFARATAAEITRRAGVTWGAVQHHFGGKDGLFLAVVDDSFQRFAARMEAMDEAEDPVKRAARFVDLAWEHFATDHYRATFEILFSHLGRADPGGEATWRERMFRAWDTVWSELFRDAPLPRARQHVLQQYAFTVLSGLASVRALANGPVSREAEQLELLKDTLARELSGPRR